MASFFFFFLFFPFIDVVSFLAECQLPGSIEFDYLDFIELFFFVAFVFLFIMLCVCRNVSSRLCDLLM